MQNNNLRVAPSCTYTLDAAADDRQLAEVAALRRRAYSTHHMDSYLHGETVEQEIDNVSWVLILKDGERTVGTIRVTPTSAPGAELRRLGILPQWADDHTDLCEATRFAVDGRRGMGIPLLRLAASWLRQNTPMRNYIALSRPRTLEMFQRIGATVDDDVIPFGGGDSERCRLVYGSLATVISSQSPAMQHPAAGRRRDRGAPAALASRCRSLRHPPTSPADDQPDVPIGRSL